MMTGKQFRRALRATVREHLQELREEKGMEGTTLSFRFSLNRAIYWFCTLHYYDQYSYLYRVLSTSAYKPGCCEKEPAYDDECALDYDLYEALCHYSGY